jgi:hypothetical protein
VHCLLRHPHQQADPHPPHPSPFPPLHLQVTTDNIMFVGYAEWETYDDWMEHAESGYVKVGAARGDRWCGR